MATLFMRIDGNDSISGSATIGTINDKKGWFGLYSASWGGTRGVNIEIGNADNKDSGMVHVSEVSCSKAFDGASAYLATFLLEPGDAGKKIYISNTKPSRTGKGVVPFLEWELENARISSYNLSMSDGGDPSESFSMVYAKVTMTHYIEDEGGKVTKGGVVGYDLSLAEVTSAADLK